MNSRSFTGEIAVKRQTKAVRHKRRQRVKEKMVAFCGITCSDCRALIATQKNDRELKKKVAKSWSTEKETLKPEDIDCEGCLPTGRRLFKFCKICQVRRCGCEKGVENCAHCREFPCEKLTGLWKHFRITKAKATLEKIRDGLRA
jgi:hypothetical protein